MTIFDNIAFPLESQGMARPEIKSRVEEVAEVLDLTPHLRRRPKNLSGGQRQRVAMGRAIVRRPKAFLMDEPLSNLDAKLRVQMRAEITRLQRSLGTTTLYVTHDQVEAMTMGDRIAVMNKGLLQQVGTPMELYERPANMFVAAFVGSPSMNLLTVNVDRTAQGIACQLGAQRVEIGPYPELERYAGRTVVLGIRPEDCVPAGPDTAAAPVIKTERSMVELLPPEQLVHLDLDKQVAAVATDVDESAEQPLHSQGAAGRVVARIPSNIDVGPGRSEWALRRLHFFDPDSGAAVLRT
jgi:multiple sugar transport system ATP-binding protein